MGSNDTNPIAIDAYLAGVFKRRMQNDTLHQILSAFPDADRSLLIEQMEDLARRLDSLIEATNKSQEPLSLDLMLVQLVALITEAFDADRSSLFLYDAETDELFSPGCARPVD